MENKSKRIGTFKQFQKEKRQQKINEEKINLEIEWWDECIVEVMQELEKECQGYLVWNNLIQFCKEKWIILGRQFPQPEYDDNLLTQHIKDLIFQFHGQSFYTDWKCDMGYDNQQVHSKGLVIEELAAEILEKVKEKAKPESVTQTKDPIGVLSDRDDVTLVPMKQVPTYNDCEDDFDDEYYEDLPFEYKYVQGFEKFTKIIEEAKTEFKLANQEEVIDHTLKKIEQEVGSLDLDDIAKVVVDKYGPVPENKGNVIFDKYIKNIVMSYLDKKGIVQTQIKKKDGLYCSKNVLNGIYNLFAEMAVDEIEHILTSKARKEGEDEEVE